MSERHGLAKSILKAALKYRREFPKTFEATPTARGGFTIWAQDFEFDPDAVVDANEVYAGITAVLWAGRQLLGKDFLIIPVPASSLFKNLGEFNTKKILRGRGEKPYLAALQLKALPRNNPEGGRYREWNFLSMLYQNGLIDGFLGQQYSMNNPDALPGSISKDTRQFYPRQNLPYAIISSYDDPPQLSNTTISNKPWKSYFHGSLPFKLGVYFAGEVPIGVNPAAYLSPSRQSLKSKSHLRIDATNLAYRKISGSKLNNIDWNNGDFQGYAIQGQSIGRDRVIGSDYHDIIQSGCGRDRLIGGSGSDLFLFGFNDCFGEDGVDIIEDFNPREGDMLGLSKSIFKDLNSLKLATASTRKQLKKLFQNDANVLYMETTGQLFYDENGGNIGMGEGGLFSRLESSPLVQAHNIQLF